MVTASRQLPPGLASCCHTAFHRCPGSCQAPPPPDQVAIELQVSYFLSLPSLCHQGCSGLVTWFFCSQVILFPTGPHLVASDLVRFVSSATHLDTPGLAPPPGRYLCYSPHSSTLCLPPTMQSTAFPMAFANHHLLPPHRSLTICSSP